MVKQLLATLVAAAGAALALQAAPMQEEGLVLKEAKPITLLHNACDPAPLVVGDRLYVYTSWDASPNNTSQSHGWRVYSTTDMQNWQDHGPVATIATFKWADQMAWAPQCVERGGKYYLYCPVHNGSTGIMSIGVAVSDKPEGPFRDALERPLIDNLMENAPAENSQPYFCIDPTILIDDDGKAYLYYGREKLCCARLGDDMISVKGEIKSFEMTEKAFGAPVKLNFGLLPTHYSDSPWAMKRGNTYYLFYTGGIPQEVSYSTAKSPLGPWKYRGKAMSTIEKPILTQHSSVVDFKGKTYFFHHSAKIFTEFMMSTRSMTATQFEFNSDGTMPTLAYDKCGVEPIKGSALNAYQRQESETIAAIPEQAINRGLTTEPMPNGMYLSNIINGMATTVCNIDFSTRQPQRITICAASALQDGIVEVIRGRFPNGEVIATVKIDGTGGWEQWKEFSADVKVPLTGLQDLTFVYHGFNSIKLFNLDWWKFE